MKRLTALAMVCMLVWLGASVVSADEPCTTFGSGYAVAEQSSEVLDSVPEDSGFKIDVPLGPVALPSALSDGVMLAADGETTILVPNSSSWSYRGLNGAETLNSSSGFFLKLMVLLVFLAINLLLHIIRCNFGHQVILI